MMTDMLFDAPWWLPAGLIVAGAVVFITANRRSRIRLRTAGIVIVLLGPLVMLLSHFIDTPGETAEKGSRAIVAAFVARDWTTMQSLLAASASVSVLDAELIYDGEAQILAGARTARDQHGIDRATVTDLTVTRTGPLITTEIDVLSEQTSFPYPLPTTWQLEWRVDPTAPGGWAIAHVTCIRIGNASGPEAARQFPPR
jgi:hypothetical protein